MSLVQVGDGQRQHCIAVVGRGPAFDHRFGAALAAAGLLVKELTVAARSRVQVVVASSLDGWRPEQGLPEEADGLPWVVLAESLSRLPDAPAVAAVLSPQSSAEALVFTLNSIVFEAVDRRRDARALAQLLVRYQVVSSAARPAVISAELANLSLGGGFVRSLRPPLPGTEVVLEIVAGDAPAPLLLSGRVVHSIAPDLEAGIVCSSLEPGRAVPSHPGFAVAFDPPPDADVRHRLQRMIERLRTSPLDS
jgi:hypothetical protein